MSEDFDPEIREWATPRQVAAIDAMVKYGSIEEAATSIGVSTSRLRRLLSEAKQRAARRGYSPSHDMDKTVPDGFHVKGVSTYYGYDKEGNFIKRGQWVKTQRDQEHRVALLLDALQAVTEPLQRKSEYVVPPKHAMEDLLTVYPMGDPHIGMFAWALETGGENFDVQIGERNLIAAVDHLVSLAPPSKTALIVNLGDFFHTDTKENRTARSGNPLDVDSRWQRVLEIGIKIMRRCIDRALEKHEKVIVINEIGNHDDHSAVMLSMALDMYYENNPRVEVDTSPDHFHWYRFGKCLIGVTHGDGAKIEQLPLIMANDKPEDWGATSYRYWYTGHVHHDKTREFPGVIVETFRTLAPRDAWHHHSGYRSGRDMKCDIIHRNYGRINRHIVGIEQIR